MNYLISRCDLFNLSEQEKIEADVWHQFEFDENKTNLFLQTESGEIVCVNSEHSIDYCTLCEFLGDKYFFVLLPKQSLCETFCFSYNGKNYTLNFSSKLHVFCDNSLIFEKDLCGCRLKFSHSESFGKMFLVYFEGRRNFVLVLHNDNVFADFYDELNNSKNEKWFMRKLCDSLNHGRVINIKDNKIDEYLVYLDENELKLKDDFVPLIFFDCVLANNFNYALELLCESLKTNGEVGVKEFFGEFDYFCEHNGKYFLLNKNALVGIYRFEIVDCKIENIVSLM